MTDENTPYLQITIDRKNPITPEDLAIALTALSSLYDHHPGKLKNSKIVIGRVNEACIDIFIYIAIGAIGSAVGTWAINKILDRAVGDQFDSALDIAGGKMKQFAEHLKKGFEKTKENLAKMKNNRENKHFQKLAKMGDGDDRNTVTFQVYDGKKKEKYFHFSGKEANRIIEQAIEEEIKRESFKEKENLEFFWIPSNTLRSRGTDKGLITKIDPDPQKVIFRHSSIKRAMLEGAIFEKKYLVDVIVHYENSKLKRYEIKELRMILDGNEEEIPRFLSP